MVLALVDGTQLKDGPGNVKVVEIYPSAVQMELHDTKHQPDLKDGYLIGMLLDQFIEETWDKLVQGDKQIPWSTDHSCKIEIFAILWHHSGAVP